MIYESIPRKIEAEQFDGADVAKITALTGEENILLVSGHLQVHLASGLWEDILPGWWVIRNADGSIGAASTDAFARYWREADGSHAGA